MRYTNLWGKLKHTINGSGIGWGSTHRKKKIRLDSQQNTQKSILSKLKSSTEIQITQLWDDIVRFIYQSEQEFLN